MSFICKTGDKGQEARDMYYRFCQTTGDGGEDYVSTTSVCGNCAEDMCTGMMQRRGALKQQQPRGLRQGKGLSRTSECLDSK
jgi:hypothetical protein